MDIKLEKLNIIEMILQINREDLLLKIKQLLREESSEDWWKELSMEERESIERGLDDIEGNRTISLDEFKGKLKTGK